MSETEPSAESPPPPLEPPPDDPAAWIDRPGKLASLCERLASCEEIALDTEANSMHAYREQTCIVQVSADGENAIIDPLAVTDLGPLREAIDRPNAIVVLHGGDYDIACLTRDYDFRFHRVFDTMIAATLLGIERVGLASLVESHFGVTLEKRFQRADWARRPVSDEQLDYLRRDTIYLSALRAHLTERLTEDDLLEEAQIEFSRLIQRKGSPAVMDPDRWRRIKGSAKLDDLGRCVLRSLHLWREREAERRDVPPFKVFPPQRMLQLAAKPPRNAHHPRTLPFVSHGERSRYGKKLVAAIQEGIADHGAGRIPPRSQKTPLSPDEARHLGVTRKREEALKSWRRDELARRKVPSVVVLPNPALRWLASEGPMTREDLLACPDIGAKRVERYGDALLEILDKTG